MVYRDVSLQMRALMRCGLSTAWFTGLHILHASFSLLSLDPPANLVQVWNKCR